MKLAGKAAVFIGLAVALSSGCGPSIKGLVKDGKLEEAMCGALHFSSDQQMEPYVLDRLDERADPAIHVRAVTAAQLGDSIGAAAEAIHKEVIILRVVADAHAIDAAMSFNLELDAGPGAMRELPTDREALAKLTQEHVPESRTRVLDPGGRRLTADGAGGPLGLLAAGTFELLFLGLIPFTEMTGHVKRTARQTESIKPTDAEYLKGAPVTETLFRSMAKSEAHDGWMQPKQWFSMWTRPATDRVRLVIGWSYEAYSEQEGRCDMSNQLVIPLPPGGTIEARINRLFGPHMRTLAELRSLESAKMAR